MAVERMVNGLDLEKLIDTRRVIEEHPDLAKITFRSVNRWDDGAHCFTSIQDFNVAGQEDTTRARPFVIEAGEPSVLLGNDEAPNATEILLHALSSCLNTTFIMQATAQGVRVEELQLNLEGTIDLRGFLGLSENVRNGFQNIHVTFKVKADASEEKIQELCNLAQQRSPVFDCVTHEVPVNASIEIKSVEEKPEIPLKPGM